MTLKNWTDRAEHFNRVRAHLRQILSSSNEPLDLAEIATLFKQKFRYLPSLERRLRELVESKDVVKHPGQVPRWEFVREK